MSFDSREAPTCHWQFLKKKKVPIAEYLFRIGYQSLFLSCSDNGVHSCPAGGVEGEAFCWSNSSHLSHLTWLGSFSDAEVIQSHRYFDEYKSLPFAILLDKGERVIELLNGGYLVVEHRGSGVTLDENVVDGDGGGGVLLDIGAVELGHEEFRDGLDSCLLGLFASVGACCLGVVVCHGVEVGLSYALCLSLLRIAGGEDYCNNKDREEYLFHSFKKVRALVEPGLGMMNLRKISLLS